MSFVVKYAPLAAALHMLWLACFMETKNALSAFIFQFLPALLGFLLLLPFAVEALK